MCACHKSLRFLRVPKNSKFFWLRKYFTQTKAIDKILKLQTLCRKYNFIPDP